MIVKIVRIVLGFLKEVLRLCNLVVSLSRYYDEWVWFGSRRSGLHADSEFPIARSYSQVQTNLETQHICEVIDKGFGMIVVVH